MLWSVTHPFRARSRRYLTRLSALFLFLLLYASISRSEFAESPRTEPSGRGDVPGSENDQSSSFLLLCLTDGSLYTMDAWTGRLSSRIVTEPLLRKNRAPRRTDASSHAKDPLLTEAPTSAIVPGLDGRLYSYSESSHSDDSYHPPLLEALPLTIHSILQHPVRSCPSSNPRDCGILTATAQTTLLGLNEQGNLLWKSQDGSFSSPNGKNDKNSVAPLLLQRKDYWVQHVSTNTGMQSWNVSLGQYQALDFAANSAGDDDDDADDNDTIDELDKSATTTTTRTLPDPHRLSSGRPALPAISFSNAGRTLTAVDPDTGTALWQQTTPSVLSSVFGITKGQWKPLTILEDDDEGTDPFPILEQNEEGLKFAVQRRPLPIGSEQQKEASMAEFWTQAAWEAAQAAQLPDTRLQRQQQQKLLPGRPQHQKAVCLLGECPNFMNPGKTNRLGLPKASKTYDEEQ